MKVYVCIGLGKDNSLKAVAIFHHIEDAEDYMIRITNPSIDHWAHGWRIVD